VVLAAVAVVGLAVASDPSGLDERRAYLYAAIDRWQLSTSTATAMLQDPFPETRRLAAQALAGNPDIGRLRLYGELAADSSPWTRHAALIGVGRLAPEGLQLALAGIGDSSPLVRQAAVWAASHNGPTALEPLTRVLLLERSEPVRETALANMWRLGEAVWEPHVARYASHTNPNLRRAAAYSLARSISPRRSVALITLSQDPEPVIRTTAIAGFAAGELTSAERGLVVAALSDADWRVQAAACRVLAARPEFELDTAAAERLAELWSDRRGQLAVPAIEAAGSHPRVGRDSTLGQIASTGEPWPAGSALVALARRGAEEASALVAEWLADEQTWRRRAAARASHHIDGVGAGTLRERLQDSADPAVRLAWLESLARERVAANADVLERIVESDDDPVVRGQALDLLAAAGLAGDVDRLLALARRWRDDGAPDGRVAALSAALGASGGDRQRSAVLEVAAADPDPAVAATVVVAARRVGIEATLSAREQRHDEAWYRELVTWSGQDHWLDVVTVRGTFRIKLESLATPITAREIWQLAQDGFYDGLTFHRVVPNFVVQGGDPRGDGWGGTGFVLPDEPTLRPFDSWRVGIATAGANTGSCQLFVTLLPADRLTGHYTNLGEVVDGRDVLTRLQVGDRIVRIEAIAGDPPPSPPPVLLGEVTWQQLVELPGWRAERDRYQVDRAALELLRDADRGVTVLTVLGTWCSDSEREIPRLQRVLDELASDRMVHRMVGVDRTKRIDVGSFPAELVGPVERVPTVVVVDGQGQELGRIVETADRPIEQLLAEFVGASPGSR
jgi:peptidylprolyl isomerase/peptidyl-prolyl cis-trans isomerase B (cyclophilin B)